jgi:hypothetical protein
MSGITIKTINAENYEIFFNGCYVATLSHDEDGWHGINRVEHVLEQVSKHFGIVLTRE